MYLRDEERPSFWSFFYLLFPSLSLLSLHLMKPRPPPKCMLGAGQKEPLQPTLFALEVIFKVYYFYRDPLP